MLGMNIKRARKASPITKPIAKSHTQRPTLFAMDGGKTTPRRAAFNQITNSLLDDLMNREAFACLKPNVDQTQAA